MIRIRGMAMNAYIMNSAMFLAVMMAAVLARPFPDDLHRTIVNVSVLVPPIIAAVNAFRAAGVNSGQPRMGWSFIGAACTSWWLGQLAWSVQEVVLGVDNPFPSFPDIMFLLYIPLFLTGLMYFIRAASGGRDRLATAVDSIIASLWVLILVWHFLVYPHLALEGPYALAVLYPILDLFVAAFIISFLRGSRGALCGCCTNSLVLGFVVFAIADLVYFHQLMHGTYETGTPLDILWPLGMFLTGYAGFVSAGKRVTARTEVTREEEPRPTGPNFPYMSATSMVMAIAISRVVEGRYLDHFLFGGALLFLATIARLRNTINHNARLSRMLIERTRELEAANASLGTEIHKVRTLAGVSRAMAYAGVDFQSVLTAIADTVSDLFGDACVVYLTDGGEGTVKPVAHRHPDPMVHAELGRISGKTYLMSDFPSSSMLDSGEPFMIPMVTEEQKEYLKDLFGTRLDCRVESLVSVPVMVNGKAMGAITLIRITPGRPYTGDDALFLREIAVRASHFVGTATLVNDLRRSEEQATHLARQLVEVQENERRHLAKELHDEIGQALTALRIGISTVEPYVGEPVRPTVANMKAVTGQLMDQVRQLSLNLRPTVLDDYGLVPALSSLFGRFRKRTGMWIGFEHTGVDGVRFDQSVETAVYRIIQEGVTNSARHSGAGEAAVWLGYDGECLLIRVEDQGKGFDTGDHQHSCGLSGMRERAALLGGSLSIEASPGSGTSLAVTLPAKAVMDLDQAGARG